MILRPRQEIFVGHAIHALETHGNTLGVAPTGSGKTVMLSHVAGKYPTSLILQHREELVHQNMNTFRRVNPDFVVDVFKANRKRFLKNGATFAMVQTLMRPKNLEKMKPVDIFVIDESHHAAANGYLKIIERAKELNPQVKIFGVTATPIRGDKKALKGIFNNVCDQIDIVELIHSGHLVKPRTFVIDCGFKADMDRVREEARKMRLNEIDMTKVEEIMDKEAVTDRVIEEWKKQAGDRRTVVFCSTVAHAVHVTESFVKSGVTAKVIYGDMPKDERKKTLTELDRGEIQVVVNVAVLTEGFDSQPISCVVLLRPCSHKSTMIQMIGRGLRPVDQERYPGIIKDDCIVLDFGFSILTHGDLKMEADLEPKQKKGEAPTKQCCNESCKAPIPIQCHVCPICGAEQPIGEKEEKEILTDFSMCELDIINASPFKWENFFEGLVWIANGSTAWVCSINYHGRWISVGFSEFEKMKGVVRIGNAADSFTSLAQADDFLRRHGDTSSAKKSKLWITAPPTQKQLEILGITSDVTFGLTRYRASCAITWKFSENQIKAKVMEQ